MHAIAVLLSLLTLLPQSETTEPPPLWGEYTSDGRGVQVATRPDDLYEVVIFNGGLPGDGWDRSEPTRIEADADEARDLVEGSERVVRHSPTEGLKPPAGATVLYGGPEDVKNFVDAKAVEDGLLFAGARTKDAFGDFTLHVEFYIPYQPDRIGNFPGNSGVYLQDRYEIQILDDFAEKMRPNLCGAIYRQHEPRLNACYPADQWQTFDIEFRSARYDAAGKRTEKARITVRQNGQLIHENAEAEGVTGGHVLEETPADGPLYFQYHSDPVLFRNVWVQSRNEEAFLRRPRVPAFERFSASVPAAESGHWLIGELSCAACHEIGNAVTPLARTAGPNLARLQERVQPGWLPGYLMDPHGVKPGTTMPDVLAPLSEADRALASRQLTAFLTGGAGVQQEAATSLYAVAAGQEIYARVGCGACHSPDAATDRATNVPLGPVAKKWTVASLSQFLQTPHATRPSGRMPSMSLTAHEADSIAEFLMTTQDLTPAYTLEAVEYTFRASDLKEFDEDIAQNEPAARRPVDRFDADMFDYGDQFAVRYRGTLVAEEAGLYEFEVGPDDGVRLTVNGNDLAIVDGTGPYRKAFGAVELEPGLHGYLVDYYESGDQQRLTVQWKPPGVNAFTDIPVNNPKPPAATTVSPVSTTFAAASASDVAAGRKWFSDLGCAHCHAAELPGVQPSAKAASLLTADLSRGCLSPTDRQTPRYDLTPLQAEAIRQAVTSLRGGSTKTAADMVRHGLASRNCYACHQRENLGGPESSRDHLFLTTIPEMGDEGRVPPKLDHVGDKLKTEWLYGSIEKGVERRPYLLTRMPVTLDRQLAEVLTPALIELDRVESPLPKLAGPARNAHADGRRLVGDSGLACVKCHSFGDYPGTGIQAVNLLAMTDRLRKDWFHRYVIDPASLRPGTRMPTGFPNGKSVAEDVRDGVPGPQVAVIHAYLSQGEDAAVPLGLLPDPIELVPDAEPILYRNFLAGVDPRGMAVGYPEKVHLAFETTTGAVRTVWTGAFLDAAMHWRGLGQGAQSPLGDNVVRLERQTPVAVLASADAVWPDPGERVRFRGYRLNGAGQPTFRYDVDGVRVNDFLKPTDGPRVGFRRLITVQTPGGQQPTGGQVVVRPLAADVQVLADDRFADGRGVQVTVRSGTPKIVDDELRVLAGPDGAVTYDILW